MGKRIGLGLYGSNGHQIHHQLKDHPRLNLVGIAGFPEEASEELTAQHPHARVCASLAELLALPDVEMVSLCSPLRSEQAAHAVEALEAGVHVYAEKPCATTESDLDRIIEAAARTGKVFHAMAGTAFAQPYYAMRRLVSDGVIGEVVQVSAQKSYPYHDGRPTDEKVDGGLIAQNGVHALRLVENVAGVRVEEIDAFETQLGDPREQSDLKMAASMMARLENGGVAAIVANYLNPTGFGSWGNEMLRIFGTKGMLESVDGGARTHLVVGDEDRGEIDTSGPCPDWLGCVIAHVLDAKPMPLSLEEELHPTRIVLRAGAAARARNAAAEEV